MKLRPATRIDLEVWWQKTLDSPVYGYVAEDMEGVHGVMGIGTRDNYGVAFMETDGTVDRRTMVLARKLFRRLCDRFGLAIYAYPEDRRETAMMFLEKVGFQKIEGANGEYFYMWVK